MNFNLKRCEFHTNPLLKAIQIFLLALILIGSGLLVTQKSWVPKLTALILSKEINTLVPVPISDTATWHTFTTETNNLYAPKFTTNFLFQYPFDWSLRENNLAASIDLYSPVFKTVLEECLGTTSETPPSCRFDSQITLSTDTYVDYEKLSAGDSKSNYLNYQKIERAGLDIFKYYSNEHEADTGIKTTVYHINSPDSKTGIVVRTTEQYEPAFLEILNTFKFLGPQSDPVSVPEVKPAIPEVKTGLPLGEIGHFGKITILPLEVEEDSRCPRDVVCVQAGTVRLTVQIVSAIGTSTSIVKLGESVTIAGSSITLINVTPENNSKKLFSLNEYRFNFMVVPLVVSTTPSSKNVCQVGGCSGQLCTDNVVNMITTCEYRSEYACYQTAECKRQTSGQCGWTETPELRLCLATKSDR